MNPNIVLSNLIEAEVYKISGDCIGSIDELLIDPYSGIVRSVLLVTEAQKTVKLPWSAIRFDKSKRTFFLTQIGEVALERKIH